jgi:hypothetical protein
LSLIAETARDIDFALRWGFGWKQGPFELWQQAGWQQVAQWVKQDIDEGHALSKAPLPAWVFDGRMECIHQLDLGRLKKIVHSQIYIARLSTTNSAHH